MKNNKEKKFVKKRKKINGFTLVELLATLAILSLVTVIIMYTATKVINNSKEKSYMVTINNIQKESSTYVLENDKNILWLSDGTDYLYQCITVQNLIDMGYFSNDILDSKVSDDRRVFANDYIYIEKDNDNKTITRQVLLYDDKSELRNLCGDYITNAKGNISFDVPSGWATSKEIIITYRLDDDVSVGDSTNYRYGYEYDALNDNNLNIPYASYGFTTLRTASKKITVHDEGYLNVDIKGKDGSLVFSRGSDIDKIDNDVPEITESASNETVRGSVTIPIKIFDDESGVDGNSISLSDFKVSIGGNELTSGVTLTEVSHDTDGEEINYYNYNLVISDRYYVGEVVIEISADQILDSIGNKNKGTKLETGILFDNKYTITYNTNGGSGSMSNTTCTYGVDCQLRDNAFTRLGYTFVGWNTDKNATSATYSNKYVYEPFNLKDDITLYATWKGNTYKITYDANGGSGSMSNTTCTYDKDCGLVANAFTRLGYTFVGWNTKADGSGTGYTNSQDVKNLISTSGGNVTLYALWKVNTYSIAYNANGGSGSMSNTTCTYDKDCGLVANAFTRSGYAFNGWNTKADGSGTGYTNSQDVKNLISTSGGSITLYAVWKINDTTPPTCTISASSGSTTVTGKCTDDSGTCAYYGWSSSYSGDNSTKKKISTTGTVTYYVKDAAGNKNSCEATISSTSGACPSGWYKTAGGTQCYTTSSATITYRCFYTCYGDGSVQKTYEGTSCLNPCEKDPGNYKFDGKSVISASCQWGGTYNSSKGKCYHYQSFTSYVCGNDQTKLSDNYCFKAD